MILLELLWGIIKWLFYYITRPIIWIITARDCRHCKHGRKITHGGWHYNPFIWGCGITHCPTSSACLDSPWRCKFERRKK